MLNILPDFKNFELVNSSIASTFSLNMARLNFINSTPRQRDFNCHVDKQELFMCIDLLIVFLSDQNKKIRYRIKTL